METFKVGEVAILCNVGSLPGWLIVRDGMEVEIVEVMGLGDGYEIQFQDRVLTIVSRCYLRKKKRPASAEEMAYAKSAVDKLIKDCEVMV